MANTKHCEACDDGHAVPCTCTYVRKCLDKNEAEKMWEHLKCATCGTQSIERFEEQCESCFTKLKIEPLMALRELTLKEVTRIDGLLTAKLEKLARSSRHNLNLSFTCTCGQRHNTGLDLIAHLPECSGPKPQTARNGFHGKLMRVDLSDIQEIG